MKKVTLLLLFLGNFAFAQQTDILSNEITLGKNSQRFFIKENKDYRLSEYKQVFSNPEAISYIKRARTNKTFGDILGYIGGFGIGYGVASAVSVKSSDPNYKSKRKDGWVIAGAELGVIGASIPLYLSFGKNIKKGIETENGQNTTSLSTTQLNLIVNDNGAGFSLTF